MAPSSIHDALQPAALLERWITAPSRTIVHRAEKSCVSSADADTCEKPFASSSLTITILVSIGVLIAVVTIGVIFYLHLRRRKRDKLEDQSDRFQREDYGLEPVPPTTKGGKGSPKPNVTQQRAARESVQSLARSLRMKDDPFGPSAEVIGNDAASARTRTPQPQYPSPARLGS